MPDDHHHLLQVELHVHTACEAAQIARLVALLDPKTGEAIKKRARVLTANASALVEVLLLLRSCHFLQNVAC